MKKQKIIENWIKKHNGYLVVPLMKKDGIPYSSISYYLKTNGKNLEKVKRGLYRSEDCFPDIFYEISVMNPNIVFSHESALYLNSIIEKCEDKINISIPYNTRLSQNLLNTQLFKIHYLKKEEHTKNILEKNTSFGNPIKVYNLEKTIFDIIKNNKNINSTVLGESFKFFITKHSGDFETLWTYFSKIKNNSVLENHLSIFTL